jgi:hypothetical protein
MECYEGATMIKTFRGLITDGGQHTIRLHTNTGATGYRILNFQVMLATPGVGGGTETICKIYKVEQTAVDGAIDFSDQTLLAAAYYVEQDNAIYVPGTIILFEREIFNQDIYITNLDVDGSQSLNYYIELEQVQLNLDENTVATLKDIRNVTAAV